MKARHVGLIRALDGLMKPYQALQGIIRLVTPILIFLGLGPGPKLGISFMLGNSLIQGTNKYLRLYAAVSELSLDYVWWVKFYKIRESERVLSHLDPSKVWICPLDRDDHVLGVQFWPPPHRGPGVPKDVDDNDADDDQSGNEDAVDDDVVAERREVFALLDEGLTALQKAAAGEDPEHGPAPPADDIEAAGCPPEASDSDSGSSSDDSDDSSDSSASDDQPVPAKGSADAMLIVPGGCIRWYGLKGAFTATCTRHESCVKTRQSTAAAAMATAANPNASTVAKGRPVGYLAAWLASGAHAACTDKGIHWGPEYSSIPWQQRNDARAAVAAMPGGLDLLANERPKHPGEIDDEPTGQP